MVSGIAGQGQADSDLQTPDPGLRTPDFPTPRPARYNRQAMGLTHRNPSRAPFKGSADEILEEKGAGPG